MMNRAKLTFVEGKQFIAPDPAWTGLRQLSADVCIMDMIDERKNY